MTISHNDIPNTLRTPFVYIEFDNSGAVSGTPPLLHKTLLIALKNSTGNAVTGEITRTPNPTHAVGAFGEGSMGAFMARTYYKNNPTGNLYSIALDGVGTKATGSIKINGTPTYGGMLYLYVAGTLVRVTLPQHMEMEAMHTAIANAINALGHKVPVVASVTGVEVVLTCAWEGDTGNEISIDCNFNLGERFPAGIDATISPMANGSGSPDLSDVIVSLGQEWFQHIIMPFTDATNINAMRDELVRRWGPMAQIDGMAYMSKKGTFGELSEFGLNRNDHVFSCLGLYGSPTPSYLVAAAYGGAASRYIAIDPARPLQTIVLKDVVAPKLSDRFEQNERNLLLYDGISTITVNEGGEVQIERAITMYRSNSYGLPDPSYLDIMTPHTLSFLRYATRARITQKFPRHKLADDETNVNPAQAVVKPKTIKACLIELYGEHEWNGLVENMEAFKESLVVERDDNDRNRIRVLSKPDLINQFMIYSETVQFIL